MMLILTFNEIMLEAKFSNDPLAVEIFCESPEMNVLIITSYSNSMVKAQKLCGICFGITVTCNLLTLSSDFRSQKLVQIRCNASWKGNRKLVTNLPV